MKKRSIFTIFGLALSLGAFAQQEHLSIGSYSGQSEITALKSIKLTDGFHIPSGKNVRLYLSSAPFLTSVPSSNQNYILTRTFRKPVKVSELGNARTINDENQRVQYFDGLGRPLQNVELMASPGYKDIVNHIEYDGFGRESRKYLPYAEHSSANGSFKTTAAANQKAYYASTGSWDAHVAKTGKPYSETVFENSPLNRVKEQGASGEVWQPAGSRTATGGRTVVTDYGTNVTSAAEAVKLWKPTYDASGNPTGATGSTNYLAGKLYKTVVKDENWTSGKTGTVEEYKDFEDRVVLKRVWESDSKKLDTYYVYDDFGDLRYVVPPAVTVASFTTQSSDANFEHYIYGYNYDGRRRLTEKKIPGKGWEYIVYNRNDQPVLTQDAVQRGTGKWSYTKYDAFGRVTESGIFSRNLSRPVLQDTLNAEVANGTNIALWDTRPQNGVSYDNKSYPRVGSTKAVLLINYYDDYGFSGASALGYSNGAVAKSGKVRTLLTGVLVSKDDGTAPLLTVNYYDDRARLIQSMSKNHLDGTDRITNTYSFVGELETSTRIHTANNQTTTAVTTNEYDHVGRLVVTKHYIDNPSKEVTLAKNEYNEIGQLKSKAVGGDASGSNPATTISYAYNERGWTRSATSAHFSYGLNYNVNSAGAALGNAQYNGNIAQQLWGHGATMGNTYTYGYDKLNRLTSGSSTGTVMSEAITYDDMGNISNLKRDGHATGTTYAYTGNKLKSLSGVLGTPAGQDLLYDGNGNTTRDRRGMAMTYNYLNLPKTATISGTSVAYLYDAMGAKLRKTATVGGTTSQRDYVGGIEYSKVGTGASAIELIHIPEGYIERNSSNVYTYHYNLTDHLGNVRATLQRTSATTGTVIQKHDYYPFGKAKAIVVSGNNKYLYNGKEIQDELEGQYDYGARFYDAEIGRWNVVDPMAEQMSRYSPYSYAFDNPIRFVDPDGMWPSSSYSNNDEKFFDNDDIIINNNKGNEIARFIVNTGDHDYVFNTNLDVAPDKPFVFDTGMSISKLKDKYDAVGLNLSASTTVGGGMEFGMSFAYFLNGESEGNLGVYTSKGGNVGFGVGAGFSFFGSNYNQEANSKYFNAAGFAGGYNSAAAGLLGFGGAITWSNEKNTHDQIFMGQRGVEPTWISGSLGYDNAPKSLSSILGKLSKGSLTYSGGTSSLIKEFQSIKLKK